MSRNVSPLLLSERQTQNEVVVALDPGFGEQRKVLVQFPINWMFVLAK
jgi:hypothetical protein